MLRWFECGNPNLSERARSPPHGIYALLLNNIRLSLWVTFMGHRFRRDDVERVVVAYQGIAFSRHDMPEFFKSSTLFASRGRRECRVSDAPAAACARKNAHALATTGTPQTAGIPCAMVLRLIRGLPGDRAFLPPSSA